MGWAPSVADASRDTIFLHEVSGKDKLMSVPLHQLLKLTPGALKTRFPIDKSSQKGSTALAFRADRRNCLAAQEELDRRGIKFEFQEHEIFHSIYFRDPDGHELEIATYDLKGRAPHP